MNLTTNHLPLPLLDMCWLFNQQVLYGIIVSICKGKEPLHIISAINASNQLTIVSKNIYNRLKLNDPTKVFKKNMIIHPLGCNLPRPSCYLNTSLPNPFKNEGLQHYIHIVMGSNFKKG